MAAHSRPQIRSTTVLAVRKDGKVCMGADGQVTMNNMMIKGGARKVRRLYNDKIVTGFAGSTADAMTLYEKLEGKLNEHGGDLLRGCVELAKDWRSDKYLRRLEALMLVADSKSIFLLSGTGDVIEPDADVIAIGSGGGFAHAAAMAMMDRQDMNAHQVVEKALGIAASICVFTNDNFVIEDL